MAEKIVLQVLSCKFNLQDHGRFSWNTYIFNVLGGRNFREHK